jgi:hypothetical protein
MTERGEKLRLPLEARQSIEILREPLGQDLDGDLALQLHVVRAIDLTHAALAKRLKDFVGAEASAAD